MSSVSSGRLSLLAFGALCSTPFSLTAVRAQDDAAGTPQSCITVRGVDRTRAVDNKTILFFMRGRAGTVHRNELQAVCHGLDYNRGFSYAARSRTPRLCRGDLIVVRETGFTCPLGDFHPMTADEADALLQKNADATRPR